MTQDFLDSYRSTQWQEKKNKILTRDNYTCAICGKHGDEHTLMHVHHLTYKNCKDGKAWNCPDEDLVTLCEDCHKKVHSVQPFDTAPMNYAYYYGLNQGFKKASKENLSGVFADIPCPLVISPNTGLMLFAYGLSTKFSWRNFIDGIKKLPFVYFVCEDLTDSINCVVIARAKYLYGLDFYKTWNDINLQIEEETGLFAIECPVKVPVSFYDYSFLKDIPELKFFINKDATLYVHHDRTSQDFSIDEGKQITLSKNENVVKPTLKPRSIGITFDNLRRKGGGNHE